MKLNGWSKSLSVIISLSCLSFFGLTSTAKAEVSIITLKMSDQGRAFRNKVVSLKSTVALDKKDILAEIEKLKKNYSLTLPKSDTKNLLSCKKYGDNSVYALKNGIKHDTAVIYVHGGAFKFNIGPAHVHFCDRLVDTLEADVYIPLYSLIPYGTYKEAFQLLDSVYVDLLKDYTKIYIMGDSAGGTITLTYTLHRKDKKMQLPYKLVVLSPIVDMSMDNPDIHKYITRDSILNYDAAFDLMRQYWIRDLNAKDRRVSPLYGDLTGLPEILLFIAQDEILYPDAIRFYNVLQQTGNNAQLVIGNELFHAFPVFNIPEREKSLKIIKEFCK